MELFGVGPLELLVIGIVALLIFGPKKLPELSQNLGRAMRGLKDASRDFEREIKREFNPDPPPMTGLAPTSLAHQEQQALEAPRSEPSPSAEGEPRQPSA
jgi:sec-independent protein translocase protein TatA